MLFVILSIVFAYLVGSINFAVIFSRLFTKKDVRNLGSGNAGATNVLRTAGLLPGILTFIFDAFKGFVACFVGKTLILQGSGIANTFTAKELSVVVAFACGFVCMLGHVFPLFFQFKGGKGVAVAVGIFAVCNPLAVAVGLSSFAIIVLLSKTVSLGSISAATLTVITAIIFYNKQAPILPQIIFCIAMWLLIILKHTDNIKRIIRGEEKKISVGRKK